MAECLGREERMQSKHGYESTDHEGTSATSLRSGPTEGRIAGRGWISKKRSGVPGEHGYQLRKGVVCRPGGTLTITAGSAPLDGAKLACASRGASPRKWSWCSCSWTGSLPLQHDELVSTVLTPLSRPTSFISIVQSHGFGRAVPRHLESALAF